MPLRRIPISDLLGHSQNAPQPDYHPAKPLGVIELGFRELKELEYVILRHCKQVKLYAGEGLAPRGVADLDDATPKEISNIKVAGKNPRFTLRLGPNGAFASYEVDNIKTRKLHSDLEEFAEKYRTRRLHSSIMIPMFFWLLAWHASFFMQGFFRFTGMYDDLKGNPLAGLLWLAASVTTLSTMILLLSNLRLNKDLSRRGSAMILPVRLESRESSTITLNQVYTRYNLYFMISGLAHVVVAAVFYDYFPFF